MDGVIGRKWSGQVWTPRLARWQPGEHQPHITTLDRVPAQLDRLEATISIL
jgi:hypothetical protein